MRNYRLLVGYKQLIYKDWLYAEFIPELSFREENDWDVTPGIRVRFEAFLGNRRLRKIGGRLGIEQESEPQPAEDAAPQTEE